LQELLARLHDQLVRGRLSGMVDLAAIVKFAFGEPWHLDGAYAPWPIPLLATLRAGRRSDCLSKACGYIKWTLRANPINGANLRAKRAAARKFNSKL
jgi:hypothetical protein